MNSQAVSRVLVTGGAGFIGCNFIRHLLAADSEVRLVCLDKLTYAGSRANLADLPDRARFRFVQGDIGDRALVDRLMADEDIESVVHFAAESHVDRSIADPSSFAQTNMMGTLTLLEAARAAWLDRSDRRFDRCRFHHISTDEVYGSLMDDGPAFTEASPYAPNSPYAASKAGADHLVRAYHRTYGLPVVTTNCANNYGPFQHGEKLIPTIIRACRSLTPIPIYGDGSNIRDWLHVEDHCRALEAVLKRGRIGATYNIGAGNEVTNLDLARMICAIFDELRPEDAPHDRLISLVDDRPGHDWRYALNCTKVARELGWQPTVDLENGLRRTVAWYQTRPL